MPALPLVDSSPRSIESSLRDRLGIPEDASRVVVFAESTHWDPNWMLRAGEYFRFNVRRVIDDVLDELALEPARVFDLECTFFVKRYVELSPRGEELVQRVNEGRLRFTNSGVTTADTVIPAAEALLRDFLEGQEWMRSVGIASEPAVAYFPDSFGHSPALPTVLRAAGFGAACFSRIDGMWFPGVEWQLPRRFPLEGSSAELLHGAKTMDFVWRAPDGAEVLAHWNAFAYGHGDMIAAHGLARFMHLPVVVPDRSDRHVAARIRHYAGQLGRLSRTPYSLCVLGLDFVPPVHRLVGLLERFNERHFDETGIWALNAGLDDYFALLEGWRSSLPVMDFDPNPYWTGFYTSRPSLKRHAKELLQVALAAEAATAIPAAPTAEGAAIPAAPSQDLSPVWRTIAVANHHDFITGTSPERVFAKEQDPWIQQASSLARSALAAACTRAGIDLTMPGADATASPTSGPASSSTSASDLAAPSGRAKRACPSPSWRRSTNSIDVQTERYRCTFDAGEGGRLVRWESTEGESFLGPAGIGLACYSENGGLWRMGMEIPGGRFSEISSTHRLATLDVLERDGAVAVTLSSTLAGQPAVLRFRLGSTDPLLRVRVQARVAPRRCVVLRAATLTRPAGIATAVPGGVVERPLAKLYDPTFWPLHTAAWSLDPPREPVPPGGAGGGRDTLSYLPASRICVASAYPSAVSLSPGGRLEVVAGRNAPKELGWGFLPQPALPARGYERSAAVTDIALWPLAAGDGLPENAPEGLGALLASGAGVLPPEEDTLAPVRRAMQAAFHPSDPDVAVVAVKPAYRGRGTIVRLMAPHLREQRLVELSSRALSLSGAWLCDAKERDSLELAVRRRRVVEVPMDGAIATVRLLG